jgi:lipoprotein-releasing system permease protein
MRARTFFRYFLHYIFFSRTRQRLLFIAITGLFISAFSLMLIQGIMGSLQRGLISRSKSVHGHYLIQFDRPTSEDFSELKDLFRREAVPFFSELETEVMVKHLGFAAPAKLHGIHITDERPDFLADKDFSGLVMGSELASKLKSQYVDEMQIISPAETDSLMGEVPRFISEKISDLVYTELMEVDEFEMWSRLELVQNLIRQKGINQFRIFATLPDRLLAQLRTFKTQVPFRIISWEQMNGALVWSLNLETKVMLFLFISMSFLVAIAITSGLLIFYTKIRRDLMSFWILGMSQEELLKLCYRFVLLLSFLFCLLGTGMGLAMLKVLDLYGHQLMPEIFVERQINFILNPSQILLSLLIPFGISIVFSFLSYLNFRRENQSFISVVRNIKRNLG